MESNSLQQTPNPCKTGMVSIVMPVYNVEAYLEEALQSICAQTYQLWECICVDDGSKDSSPDIVQCFAEKDPRFRLIRQENQGPGAARNNALQHIRGEFLIFVDSDDLIAPDLLETCVRRLTEDDSDVCIFGHVEFGDDCPLAESLPVYAAMPVPEGEEYAVIVPHDAKGDLFSYVGAYACNRMCRMRLIKEGGLRFPTHIRYSEDDYIVLITMALARRITFVRRPLYFYRKFREGNLSSSLKNKSLCLDFVEASRTVWAGLHERNLLNPYGLDEIIHAAMCCPYYFLRIPTLALIRKARREMLRMYEEKRAELTQLGMMTDRATEIKLHHARYVISVKSRRAAVRLVLRKMGLEGLLYLLYKWGMKVAGRR